MVALERFRSSVFAVVSCQLVTAGKAPFTALPWAFIGLLTWRSHREMEGKKEQKVLGFITISTSNFTRLNYSCSLICRLPPLGFPPNTHTHIQPRGGQAEQFYTTAILMSQHTQLAVNEVFQHCSMLIHNPKFTLKWISFCSLYYHTSAHPCTSAHTRKSKEGVWNVNEVSSSGSPDGRRDGLLFSACSYLTMIESLPAVCVCFVRGVCVRV